MTLVEILVALALSSFLLAALIQIVISNKRNVVLTESFIEVQESARLASQILSQELRLVGYRGCLNSTDEAQYISHIDPAAGDYDDFFYLYGSQHIDGINDFSTTSVGSRMPLNGTYGGIVPADGTDVIISRGATTTNMYVGIATTNGATSLPVSGNPTDLAELINGRTVITSNCVESEIFVINGTILPSPITGSVTLNFGVGGGAGPHNLPEVAGGTSVDYSPGDDVLIMNTSVWFIAPSQVITQSDGSEVLSLYKFSELHGTAQELVPFVSDMQIEYGINNDTEIDGTLDQYVDADDASLTNASQVQALKVTLTITSRSQSAADGNPIERDYTRVIMLRNGKIGT